MATSMNLPFFYGWVVVAVGLRHHGGRRQRPRRLLAALPADPHRVRLVARHDGRAFSFGFVVSAALSPTLGKFMDRRGRPCTGPGSAPDAECALGATLPRSVQ
jgi:hypothetical protein